jgi:hypothetical protein
MLNGLIIGMWEHVSILIMATAYLHTHIAATHLSPDKVKPHDNNDYGTIKPLIHSVCEGMMTPLLHRQAHPMALS